MWGIVTWTSYNKLVINAFSSDNGFSTISIDCRSMKSNWQSFSNLLTSLQHKFDIIAVTETCISNSSEASLFNLNGYTIYQMNRTNRQGGGVAIFIKND